MTRIYILIACYILILVIPLYTTIKLHTTYNSCSKKNSKRGLTGFDVARKILDSNGLTSIYIVEINGKKVGVYKNEQGEILINVENHIDKAADNVEEAHKAIVKADGYS